MKTILSYVKTMPENILYMIVGGIIGGIILLVILFLKIRQKKNAYIENELVDAESRNENTVRRKTKKRIDQKKSSDNSKKSKNIKRIINREERKKLVVPKTVAESIPYYCVYEDENLIELTKGLFSKTYSLTDINYQIAKVPEQEDMFLKYGEFINSFDTTIGIQLVINNKTINRENFEAETLLQFKGDFLDELREEHNTILKKKIREGKNNLVKEKYLIITTKADSLESAVGIFSRLDAEIVANIKKIGGAVASPLSIYAQLAILHDIYNQDAVGKFGNNVMHEVKKIDQEHCFSFEHMRSLGITTKDCIGPSGFEFKSDYGMIGDTYFRSLYLDNIPTSLSDDVLAGLTNTEFRMLTSLHIKMVPTDEAIKLVRNQIRNIQANIIERQKEASKNGYSMDLISPELQEALIESKDLLKSLTAKNQKLFLVTLVITHFADSLDALNADTETVQAIARRMICSLKKLSYQQENGLTSSLPIGYNKLMINRALTTEATSVFMPFVNQELNDRNGGMYYGLNAVSRNLIMFNRRNSKNGNGFVFGTPGSGKSMEAKEEMLNVMIASNDDCIVIDPEGEYAPMSDLLHGTVVRIAPGSCVYINPFDMDENYSGGEDDPITLKSDFIISICEVILGERYGLTPSQRSIIDRCVRQVYEKYLASMDPKTKKYDKRLTPTLVDFYNVLREQSSYEASQLADGLEIYAVGSLNIFAHQTNVEYNNRFVVYDIKDVGSTIKTLALLIVLDNVWNRILSGRSEGKYVWFYIDEIYLLFQKESSAEFLRKLYKRARKYGGIPTGITQNVSDLLENDIARTMISNSEFIQMLNQAPLDRAQLAELLNISQTQVSYITNSSPGVGLIYTGSAIIPFENKIPKETKMYRAMTTNLSEVKKYEQAKKYDLENSME